jgi:hypothetical protein
MNAIRSRLAAIRRHWVIAVIALVLVVLALVFGVLIGFLPGMAALAVFALLVWWVVLELIAWRARRTGSAPDSRREARNAVIAGVAVVVVGFGLMQAVPYGRDRTVPPVTGEPTWSSTATRDLMVRACYQCHSSEVEYPPYASIAPTSWAVQWHIDEARGAVHYSQFATDPGEANETIEVIRDGSMPPGLLHALRHQPRCQAHRRREGRAHRGAREDPGDERIGKARLTPTPGLSGGPL